MARGLVFGCMLVALVAIGVVRGPRAAEAAETADVWIGSLDAESGELVVGACYIVNGGSLEGCDENGDGGVSFDDVPVGTYTVTMTYAPAGYVAAAEFPLGVAVGCTCHPWIELERAADPPSEQVFVRILTMDAANEALIPGACYLINDGSIEGCDENGDGYVNFDGVWEGTYTVTMTRTPAQYQKAADFEIAVEAGPGDHEYGTRLTKLSGGNPAPAPSAPPVTTLPNTGAGLSPQSGNSWPLAILGACGLAVAGLAASRVRGRV